MALEFEDVPRIGLFGDRECEDNSPDSRLAIPLLGDVNPEAVDKSLVGGKGHSLLEMANTIGLSIPDGFILTTHAWRTYWDGEKSLTGVTPTLDTELQCLEERTERALGDPTHPLFVSVRSGAAVSMPGAMDTILNVGLNDITVHALSQRIGATAAYQSYVSLMQHLSVHIPTINQNEFRKVQREFNTATVFGHPSEADFQQIVNRAKSKYSENGVEFPQNPREQLLFAIQTVFNSWDNPAAVSYRHQNNISDRLGTAATIQEMVWGNSQNENAGSGVVFTRDNRTLRGDPPVDFSPNKQGDAVVGEGNSGNGRNTVQDIQTAIRPQLLEAIQKVNSTTSTPQELEFVYDGDKLFFLQMRPAPMTTIAELRLLQEKMSASALTQEQAIALMTPDQLAALLLPELDQRQVQEAIQAGDLLGTGYCVSPGNASGQLVTTLQEAQELATEPAVLVSHLTIDLLNQPFPPNIMAVVAPNGGLGSHITRRGEQIGAQRKMPVVFGAQLDGLHQNEQLTVDGTNGRIFSGVINRAKQQGSSLLSAGEIALVREWYAERSKNPWRYVTEDGNGTAYRTSAAEALQNARRMFGAHKAHEYAVFNSLIPIELRLDYQIIHVDRVNKPAFAFGVSKIVENLLAHGNDVTIRTCHQPPLPGGGPYLVITSQDDLTRAFTDPTFSKYGNFHTLLQNGSIEDILVCEIPKGKLSKDKAIMQQHCSWTVSCTSGGQVVVQVHPYSPLLRDLGEADEDRLITFSYSPTAPKELRHQLSVGNLLKDDPQAAAFYNHVMRYFVDLWTNHELPNRMAAITDVFPSSRYASPVLEGQARINDAGELQWIKAYGINADVTMVSSSDLILQLARTFSSFFGIPLTGLFP